jgi:hypothetical protein
MFSVVVQLNEESSSKVGSKCPKGVVIPSPTPCKMWGFNIIVETIVKESVRRILMKLVDVRLDFKN